MLSYRHAFHAGNHADVLKHAIVVQLLSYLTQKDKALWFVDTHAGAGAYALGDAYAQKNAEFENGIARLWKCRELPAALRQYVDEVKVLNQDGALRYYPGSPYLALQMLREQDRLRLYELHGTEVEVLRNNFRDAGRRVMVHAGDGFDGLKAQLPPPSRRGLVLIDPSYEDKRDYVRTLECLQDSLKRFATGTYAVWYPQVARLESRRFAEQLKRLPAAHWLHVSLTVSMPPVGGFGLFGSGMFVVNPPHVLTGLLQQVMPTLVGLLGQDAAATYALEQRGN